MYIWAHFLYMKIWNTPLEVTSGKTILQSSPLEMTSMGVLWKIPLKWISKPVWWIVKHPWKSLLGVFQILGGHFSIQVYRPIYIPVYWSLKSIPRASDRRYFWWPFYILGVVSDSTIYVLNLNFPIESSSVYFWGCIKTQQYRFFQH